MGSRSRAHNFRTQHSTDLPRGHARNVLHFTFTASISLVHAASSGQVKKVELSTACHVEMTTAPNSAGGPVFLLRSPSSTDHLYEAEDERSGEEWMSRLRSHIDAKGVCMCVSPHVCMWMYKRMWICTCESTYSDIWLTSLFPKYLMGPVNIVTSSFTPFCHPRALQSFCG